MFPFHKSQELLVGLLSSNKRSVTLNILNVVVNTILIWEDEGMQHLVYYVSHSIVPTETRYLNFKKLALALLVALQKLRSYFQAHPIVVFTSHLLR